MLIKTDNLGVPHFNNHDLVNMIYAGHADKVHVVLCDHPSCEIDQFNEALASQGFPKLQNYIPLDVDQKSFDSVCQSEWFMPEEYKVYDLISFFDYRIAQETGHSVSDLRYMETKEYARKEEELQAFQDRGMIQLLRYMKYLVDFMRDNKIVWGVGRGSSVSSYLLYLIGVHKINPIQYNLDWQEFLR